MAFAWEKSWIAASLGFSADGLTESFSAIETDSRVVSAGALFVALEGDTHDGHDHIEGALQRGASGLLIDRRRVPETLQIPIEIQVFDVGSHSRFPTVLSAYRQLAHAWRKTFTIPVAVVAGSAGKTTSKELLAAMASSGVLKTEGSENGFIGIPKTLLKLRPHHQLAVIEIGIDDIGTMEQHLALVEPTAAVITSIGPEHLEKLIDIETVAREECKTFEWMQTHGGTWVVSLDDPYLVKYSGKAPWVVTLKKPDPLPNQTHSTLVWGEVTDTHTIRIGELSPGAKSPSHSEAALPLPGRHNAANFLSAWTLGRALGIPPSNLIEGLKSFVPAFGRTEVSKITLSGAASGGSCTIIRDYYNSNPASLAAALELLAETPARRRWVALGDMLELGTHEEDLHRKVAAALKEIPDLTGVFLYGDRMKWLYSEWMATYTTNKYKIFCEHFSQIEELAKRLSAQLTSNDALLIKGSRGMRMERIWQSLEKPLKNSPS